MEQQGQGRTPPSTGDAGGTSPGKKKLVIGAWVTLGLVAIGALVWQSTNNNGDDEPAQVLNASNITAPLKPEPVDPTSQPTVPNDGGSKASEPEGKSPEGKGSAEAKPAAHATAPAVGINAEATPAQGLEARIADVVVKQVSSELPGETSGASFVLTLELANTGQRSVDLTSSVVNLYVGPDRIPAVDTGSASSPFPTAVPAGDTVTGTYVFRRPAGAGEQLAVEMDLGATSTVVVFKGLASAHG